MTGYEVKVATLFLGRDEMRPWLLGARAFEDLIVSATGAQQWSLERNPKAITLEARLGTKVINLMRRLGKHTVHLEAVEPDLEVDLLFVFSADLGDTCHLRETLDVISRAKKAVLIETEIWNTDILASTKCITEVTRRFSHVLVGHHSVVDQYSQSLGRPVHFLAPSTDALAFSGQPCNRNDDLDAYGAARPVDFYNVGRRDPAQHGALTRWAKETGGWYSFSSLTAKGMTSEHDHLNQMSQLLNRSSVSICNYARFNDPNRIGTSVEYGGRYFDSLAAGCVIAGQHPTHPILTSLMEGATMIEMPLGSTEIPTELTELLNDAELFAHTSDRQRSVALSRHDVSHRAANVFESIGVPTPQKITQRIAELGEMARQLAPSLSGLS